jgi:lipoprotein-releasing system permease protein
MALPVELFLAMRYLRPRRTFVSIITVLSFLGVTVGVLVLIVVLSVMDGFRTELDKRIIGFNAEITVASDGIIYESDKIVDLIEKQPGVVAASAFIRGPVLVEFHDRMTFAYIKSVPGDGDDPVLPLKQNLIMGDYELLGDSVIVGAEWSRQNAAFPSDKIDLFGPAFARSAMTQNEKNHVDVLPDEPIIRGVFKTGHYDYDQNFMLVSMEMAQHLYGIEDGGCQGIAVRLKDASQAEAVKERLNQILPQPLLARTWMDDNRDWFNAIATERITMAFILYLVMIVAAFGLCSTLITITVQKSREIGLMKALGANDFQVSGVFLFHGLVVGSLGSVFGTICGLTILHFRNPFRLFLMQAFHIQVFPSSVYQQADIPAVINPANVVVIAISAVVICVLAALLPALNAARLAPARALRYE